MQLIEIVRGEAHFTGPFKAKPFNILLDRIDVLLLFFGGIGIVKTQMAIAAKLAGQTKVQANRLCMTNVQIAVGLRRKTGNYAAVLAVI